MKVRRITSILLSLLCLCLVLTLVPATARAAIWIEEEPEVASVSIGSFVTEKYSSLEKAIAAAKNGTAEMPATITLLADIDLGGNCLEIKPDQDNKPCVFTIDLGGYTLSGSDYCVLSISSYNENRPNVTIKNGTISGSEGPDNEIRNPNFGVFASSCTVTIQDVKISCDESGVYAKGSTVNIQGGEISGTEYGVYAYSNSTVNISGKTTISGGTDGYEEREDIGVYADNSTVNIQGGEISGTPCGVYAKNRSTVTISGTNTTISGTKFGVHTVGSNITIQDATVSGTSYGVSASDGTVTISGCEISGKTGVSVGGVDCTATITNSTITGSYCGVNANNSSKVTVSGGTITGTGNDSYGVYADSSTDSSSTVTIEGGTISGTKNGVYAYGSTVEIRGGTITGVAGVYVEASSDLTISGGTISGYVNSKSYGVYADSSTVTIEGGRITGGPFANKGACSYGLFVKDSTVTISGGEISGGENPNYNISGNDCGVSANNSTVTISGENTTISGTDYGVDANNSTVTISGGTIEGDTGVKATSSSIITISGDKTTISGTSHGVYASDSEVTIENGTISGNTGIYVHCSTADIKGGEISGTKYAVHAYCRNSDEMQCSPASVTISGGTISGTGDTAYGVYAEKGSTVDIKGGTISGTDYGVYAKNSSTVTITGGKISDTSHGVYVNNSTVDIKGGTISGETGVYTKDSNVTIKGDTTIYGKSFGVDANNSTVEISGGTISGEATISGTSYGVHANKSSTVNISGENTTISGKTYGVFAFESTVNISGGKISGAYGIYAVANCEITIKGDTTISGTSYGVKAESNSTVEISGGTISGTSYGVLANNSTVNISGENTTISGTIYGVLADNESKVTVSGSTITGTSYGVFANNSTVEISGGTISGDSYGVFADMNSTVEISGGTISGDSYGVFAFESTVEISGSTIKGTGDNSYGVFADSSTVTISGEATISGTGYGVDADMSIVDIKGGTISGTGYGVYAFDSTVKISGGTISGTDYGVSTLDTTVNIQGGTIEATGEYSVGVRVNNGSTIISGGTISGDSYGVSILDTTVNIQGGTIEATGEYSVGVRVNNGSTIISGGTISGTTFDLYNLDSTITLTLAEGASKGATFPGGITVEDAFLEHILDEASGIRYWGIVDGKDVMLNGITGTALTDKGDITVRAVCDHTGSAHTEATDKGDGTHGYTCTICQNPATEDHPYHPDHGKCICGAQAVARIGDAYYIAFADAANAWHEGGGTLTLLTDISHDTGINTNTPDSVLELNGRIFTITADTAVWVTEEATLTIRDSSADGTGKVVAAENSPLYNNGGTVVLESGTMTGYFIVNNGTMTINGGSVITSEQHAIYNKSTLTINGGTISSSHDSAIRMYDNGTITVNGGTISGNSENNGTIKVLTATNSAEDMALTLNGGTVSGPVAVETNIGINTVTVRLTLGNVKLNSTQADLELLARSGCKVEVRLTQVPEEPYTVNPCLTDGILLFGYSSDSVPADPTHYKSTNPGVLIGKNESGVVYAYICDHSGSQHTTGTTLVTGGHSFVCTVCQLNGFEDHHGGTATCMKPAKCAICRADYGEKNPDNHCGETFLHGEKKATCSAEGYTGDTVCYCGTLMAEGTVIPKLPHTYQDGECTGCGQPDPDVPDDDGEGEPGIPSEPTEPAPSDPTEPAPTDPTEPAPSDPTEPAPSDPTEPAPSDPTEPSEPEEPETPATSGIIRLAGKDRYLTGFAIADQLKQTLGVEKFQTVIVAYGKNFPDALSGSYLAAVKQAPILLTESGRDTEVLQYIQENLVSGGKVYILGGTAAVSLDFEKGAADFGYSVERLKGANRFDTNLAILEAAGIGTTEQILIATGKNYADSLSASATGLPMVLVDQELTQAQKDFLAKTSKNFVILGGTGAVSADVEAQLDAIGDVTRVKGASRYETSVEIAKKFFTGPTAAVLAYAQSFPDGLCGGPLARSLGAPMILTSDDSFAAADAYISGITTGVVCGGSARISDDTVREIFDLSADTPIVKP